jgi:tight adherence protein C
MLLAAAVLTCLGMTILVYGLLASRDREAVAEAIMADIALRSRADPYADKLREPWTTRLLRPAMAQAGAALKAITPRGLLTHYDAILEMAGRPGGLTPELFTGIKVLSIASGLVLAVLGARYGAHYHKMLQVVGGALPLALGLLAPEYYLNSKVLARRRAFAKAFPDVVDLLVVSVEAGVGLDGAVQEVVKRRKDVASDELSRVLDLIRVGLPRADAWRKLTERMPLPELAAFVAVLVQAEQLGTSIAQVLRAQSEAVRLRRSLTIREVAAKMPVKMLFPMIFFIFPCVFIVILGPGALKILHTLAKL